MSQLTSDGSGNVAAETPVRVLVDPPGELDEGLKPRSTMKRALKSNLKTTRWRSSARLIPARSRCARLT